MAEAQTDSPVDNPGVDTAAAPKPAKKADKVSYWWGTGRRKSSVARVRIKLGGGKLLVNKRELNDYFARGPMRGFYRQYDQNFLSL